MTVFATSMTTAFANTAASQNAYISNEAEVVFISPRTGVNYVLDNPTRATMEFKANSLEAANATTAERIVASNPALSPESQQKARQTLADGVK